MTLMTICIQYLFGLPDWYIFLVRKISFIGFYRNQWIIRMNEVPPQTECIHGSAHVKKGLMLDQLFRDNKQDQQ